MIEETTLISTLKSHLLNGEEGKQEVLKWLENFLVSDGGNDKLWKNISKRIGTFTISIEDSPLETLPSIMGPEGSGTTWEESTEKWNSRVDSISKAISDGTYVPPPFISTNFWDSNPTLADGNHRKEALLRLGKTHYSVIFLLQEN